MIKAMKLIRQTIYTKAMATTVAEAIKEIYGETAIEEIEEASKAKQAFEIALGTGKHVTEHVTKSAISVRS